MSRPLILIARALAVLSGAWVAGAALCVMKGDAGGLLNDLGNLSAPYAIAAVIGGLHTRRFWAGALLGVAATEVMLGGFYWAYASLLGHEVSSSTLTFWGGLGLVSGVGCGLIGRAAVSRPALWYCVPALLLFEPIALQIEVFTSRFGLGEPDVTAEDLIAYAIEIAIGIAVLLVVRARVLHARRRHPPQRTL